MRRLVRNIEGEPPPLIMHRRLWRPRRLDVRVRGRVSKALGLSYKAAALPVATADP